MLNERVTGISRSPPPEARRLHSSRVGVRSSPGASSDARLLVSASASTRVSLPTSSIPEILTSKEKDRILSCLFLYERVTGVGPVSSPWQGLIITVIRYPRFVFFSTWSRWDSNPHAFWAQHFKCCVYTSSTTGPFIYYLLFAMFRPRCVDCKL